MRKLQLTLLAMSLVLISTSAFSQAFAQGAKIISVGYGWPNLGKSIVKAYDAKAGFNISGIGPVHFKFEYGVSEHFGIGLSVNYVDYTAKWTETYDNFNSTTGLYETGTYNYQIKYSSLSALLRMNNHWDVSENVDVYAGFGIGYRSGNTSSKSTDSTFDWSYKSIIPVGFEATAGVRYFFTPALAGYVEAGIAKSAVQIGLAGKF